MSMEELITYHWDIVTKLAKVYDLPMDKEELVGILEAGSSGGAERVFLGAVQFNHGWLVGAADAADMTLSELLENVEEKAAPKAEHFNKMLETLVKDGSITIVRGASEPKPEDWVCPECGSDEVQYRTWVAIKTGEPDNDQNDYYCPYCGLEFGKLERRKDFKPSK